MASKKESLQKELKKLGVAFKSKDNVETLEKLLEGAKAPAPAADLGASGDAPAPQEETPEEVQARLEAEVDAATAAPADKAAVTPAGDSEVVENKGVKTLNPPPRKFVAVGTDIFNPKGVHVGSEANENVAARKAERFNDLQRQHKTN